MNEIKCIMLFLLILPSISAQASSDPYDYKFNDASIVIVGRCQAIYGSEPIVWDGGFYRGYLKIAGVGNFVFYIITVYKNGSTIYHSTYKSPDVHTHGLVFLRNTTGTFLLTNRLFIHSTPFLYINACAEEIYITEG
jgi:hypothetical protein